SVGNVLALEPGSRRRGRLGFHVPTVADPVVRGTMQAAPVAHAAVENERQAPSSGSPITGIVRAVLHLPPGIDLSGTPPGVTAGWDPLKHMELLLEIEAALGIRFSSEEMAATHSFPALDTLCGKKLAARTSQ